MTTFLFLTCAAVAVGAGCFLFGVLLAGGSAYERGWDDRGRHEAMRQHPASGFVVLDQPVGR